MNNQFNNNPNNNQGGPNMNQSFIPPQQNFNQGYNQQPMVNNQPQNFNQGYGQPMVNNQGFNQQPNNNSPQGTISNLTGMFIGEKISIGKNKNKGNVRVRRPQLVFSANQATFELSFDFMAFGYADINKLLGIDQVEAPVYTITIKTVPFKNNQGSYMRLESVNGFTPVGNTPKVPLNNAPMNAGYGNVPQQQAPNQYGQPMVNNQQQNFNNNNGGNNNGSNSGFNTYN